MFGRRRQRQKGNRRDPDLPADPQYRQLHQEAEDEEEEHDGEPGPDSNANRSNIRIVSNELRYDSLSIRTHAEEQFGLDGQESVAHGLLPSTHEDGST